MKESPPKAEIISEQIPAFLVSFLLNPRQLRFWGLVLGLPYPKVTEWVETDRNTPWELRVTK